MHKGGESDSLLDQIFSAVHLAPVSYDDETPKSASIDNPRYSEDEQTAIRQLDDFLHEQRSTSGSLLDTEPSEEDLPELEQDDDISTLKSARSSRANTDIQGGYELRRQSDFSVQSAHVNDDWSTAFEQPRLGRPPAALDEEYQARKRSQTYDSQASAAESRFGGFDLCNEDGNNNDNEIDLHHNEVAYHRPAKAIAKNHSSKLPEPVIDKKPLLEYQRQLIEAKEKERRLNQEIHKTQAQVLSKEFQVRQATQNVKKQLSQRHGPKRISQKMAETPSNHRQNAPEHVQQPQYHQPKYLPDIVQPPPYQAQHLNAYRRESSPVDVYEEEVPVSIVLNAQLENAELVEVFPEFRCFVLQHKQVKLTEGIEKYIIGGHQKQTDDDKAVLLFGPTSSGKTTLVNSMINYLYDVKKEHDIRLCVNYPSYKEPTEGINVYVFNNTIYPYSITVIDTPGVPNRKGYTSTSVLIKNWFDIELKTYGSLRIDAISIVLRHDEGELGWPLINELAAIKRLLKDDLRTNVMPVTTFGEVLPQPQALRSIVFANIPFISYYKINNVGYMQLPSDKKPLQHIMSYKHSVAEIERYFADLHDFITPLLAVTHQN